MYTSDEKYKVLLKSTSEVNMSNWQISKTLDILTMVNNKFVILNKINELLNNGVDKKNIFVTDKSFLIGTNYKTYFENGHVFKSENIIKIYNLGKMITMLPNEDIYKINALFDLYKGLNSITNKNLKCRIRSEYLKESYELLFSSTIEDAFESLLENTKNQVCEIFNRHISPDYQRRNSIIQQLDQVYKKIFERVKKNHSNQMEKIKEKFVYTYNRFDRPVIGVYHPESHYIEILNYDQMYKNGEESNTQIKLESITKNSPVAITVLVTGCMVGFMGYLLHREHNVTNQEHNIFDVPQSDQEAINNIMGNPNGSLLRTTDIENVDVEITDLAQGNLNKLKVITNKNNVRMEMIKQEMDID